MAVAKKTAKKPAAKLPKSKKFLKGDPEAVRRRYTKFAHAYLANNGNGTEAAIKAGFSPRTAYAQACRLLKRAEVKEIIAAAQQKTFADLEISTDRILKERARLAFYDPQKLYDARGKRIPIHKLDKDTAAAIQAIESGDGKLKTRMHDKHSSLQALERMRGMYAKDNEQLAPPPADGEDSSLNAIARGMAFIFRKAMQNGGK